VIDIDIVDQLISLKKHVLNYTVIHKIGTPLYFYNNFFKC